MDFERLNIGVIIPTRNSMPHIQEHIQDLNEWIECVDQVVVVDSESSDGTLEYMREHLCHHNVQWLSHPPGLYQSWNAAIQQVRSKYTYIATVNDRMPFDTLACLYEEAERHQADVVVSAPNIVAESGLKEQEWPIHRFLRSCEIDAPHVVDPLELLVLNSIDLPGTLIGSSASNLYRTAALQEQPFPCDYGHAGDSAWAILSSLLRRWVVLPNLESTFWYHGGQGPSRGKGRALRARLYELAREQVAKASALATPTSPEQAHLAALQELLDLWRSGQQASLEYQAYREAKVPWVLLPSAWKSRARKNKRKHEFKTLGGSLLHQIRERYSQ